MLLILIDADPELPNPKTSWDATSYLLMMTHNVYQHIDAVQEANRLCDIELTQHPVDFNTWTKEKKNSNAQKVSNYLPSSVLYYDAFVKKLFAPDMSYTARRDFIANNKSFLDTISHGSSKGTVFNDLFGD